jgi:hypothetical protein
MKLEGSSNVAMQTAVLCVVGMGLGAVAIHAESRQDK